MKEIIKSGVLIGLIVFLTMFSTLFLGWVIQERQETKEQHTTITIQEQHEPDHKALNQENVLYWLNYFEVQYPEIVLAQSIQECGWKYDSHRAETYNNIFGFETGAGALSFGHWVGSVIYYKKWQDTYYPGGDYLEFLESYGYAADTLYTVKVKQIVSLIEAE